MITFSFTVARPSVTVKADGALPSGKLRLYARAAAHFAQVAQKPEAGDVGHRFHAVNVGERRNLNSR